MYETDYEPTETAAVLTTGAIGKLASGVADNRAALAALEAKIDADLADLEKRIADGLAKLNMRHHQREADEQNENFKRMGLPQTATADKMRQRCEGDAAAYRKRDAGSDEDFLPRRLTAFEKVAGRP